MSVSMLRLSWIPMFVFIAVGGCSRPGDTLKKDKAVAVSLPNAVEEDTEGLSLQALQIPFVENQGQIDPSVRYYAQSAGGTLLVNRNGELVFRLPATDGEGSSVVSVREALVGARVHQVRGAGPSGTKVNHYSGRDPSRWRENLPTYDEVTLGDVYPDIELRLRARGGTVEKLFFVNPGGDPSTIETAVHGPDALSVSEDGRLLFATTAGQGYLTRPAAYQLIDGTRRPVEVAYRLTDAGYGFELGAYDRGHELVIDPILATYYGGEGREDVFDIVTWPDDPFVYVAGYTESVSLPGPSLARSDRQAFVAKFRTDLEPAVSAVSVAFMDGSGDEEAQSITLVPEPNPGASSPVRMYVSGTTSSTDFPVSEAAYEDVHGSAEKDGFIVHLDGDLTLVAATFLGQSRSTRRVVVDADYVEDPVVLRSLYVAGEQDGAYGFVLRMNRITEPVTVVAGSSRDITYSAIEVMRGENTGLETRVLLAGDFYVYDAVGGYIERDAYVARARLISDPWVTESSARIGGSRLEFGLGLAWDEGTGDVYVAGSTVCVTEGDDADWIDTGADPNCGPRAEDQEAFVVQLSSELAFVNATYLGGSSLDRAYDLAVHNNEVYVAGYTNSNDFPGTAGGLQPTGGQDVFVARLSKDLETLHQATYLGGSGDETGNVALTPPLGDDLFVAAGTTSDDLPGVVRGVVQDTPGGGRDAFVARLDADLAAPDADADGVSDEEEDSAGPDNDGNDDGVPDSDQPHVTTLYTFDRSDHVTIEVRSVGDTSPVQPVLENVRAVNPGTVGGGVSEDYDYPWGWFSFTIVNENSVVSFPGNVEVWIHGIDEPIDDYRKFGPSSYWPAEEREYSFWRDNVADSYPGSAEEANDVGASYSPEAERVALTFKSGLLGDHDLTDDGMIVDPGGPAVLGDSGAGGAGGDGAGGAGGDGAGGVGGDGGSGSGCSCRVQEPRNAAGTGLLVGMVAFFLMRRRRRKA